jgi:hypothetical protein
MSVSLRSLEVRLMGRILNLRPSIGDQYFLDSSSKISAFFEPSALDPNDAKKLVVPKQQSINKIGHALCQLDPVFKEQTLGNENLKQLARDLGMHKDPLGKSSGSRVRRKANFLAAVLQSMIICKQPRIGGKVPIHNDSTFLYTDPPSAVGFWIALEQCTPENGALVSPIRTVVHFSPLKPPCCNSPFCRDPIHEGPSPSAFSDYQRVALDSWISQMRKRKPTLTGKQKRDGNRNVAVREIWY